MANTSWVQLANWGPPWQTASGTALTTAATLTLSPEMAGGVGGDPAILQFTPALVIEWEARGIWTCGSTATNATLALYASAAGTAAAGGTLLATTGAFALPVSQTGLYWKAAGKIQTRQLAQGTSTPTLYTHGDTIIQTAPYEATLTNSNMQILPMPAASGPTAADVDTTFAHTIALAGTLSQVTGAPSLTCTQFFLWTHS